jgi:hypothetical protein
MISTSYIISTRDYKVAEKIAASLSINLECNMPVEIAGVL